MGEYDDGTRTLLHEGLPIIPNKYDRSVRRRGVMRKALYVVGCVGFGLALFEGVSVITQKMLVMQSSSAASQMTHMEEVGSSTGAGKSGMRGGSAGSSKGAKGGNAGSVDLNLLKESVEISSVEVSNEYTDLYGAHDSTTYTWLRGNKQIVEPYRTSSFKVVWGPEYQALVEEYGEDNTKELVYTWTIVSPSGQIASLTGDSPTHTFTELEDHDMFLVVHSSSGAVLDSYNCTLVCKYVRREIRKLTDGEREELLNSMFTMWKLDMDEGVARYGEHYASIEMLTQLHFRAAADETCDHFHEGMGFLTSHILMTNRFEASLQAINPKLSVPYWDMTLESHEVTRFYDNNQNVLGDISPIFRADWFGSIDSTSKEVVTGRWAYTAIPAASARDKEFAPASPYGTLRSAWSTDNRRYLNRGMGDNCDSGSSTMDLGFVFPTCEINYDLNQLDNFYDYVYEVQGRPHGSVHYFLGGVMDCRPTYEAWLEALGAEDVVEFFLTRVHDYRKNGFRWGLWSCNNTEDISLSVSTTELMESGTCGCQDMNFDDTAMVTAMLDKWIPRADQPVLEGYSAAVKRAVALGLCSGVMNEGDNLLSSSPMDPIFWIIHPSMERLYHVKALNEGLDVFWPPTSHGAYMISKDMDDCMGHHPYDIWPFQVVDDADLNMELWMEGKWTRNTYENYDLLLRMDPDSNTFGYIYDDFLWEHCDEEGYHMSDVKPASTDYNSVGIDPLYARAIIARDEVLSKRAAEKAAGIDDKWA